MADKNVRINNFNDKTRPATITAVYPQTKTVDIQFTQQDGTKQSLELPYTTVGATWGRLFMPQIGDRVIIDYTQGELPIITAMKPTNVDFLPYVYPGELVDMNSDGSYVHLRNARRRVKSTNALIAYDATKGPNGETDIQTEPGGIVMGIRSKQDNSTKAPRWYEHSYFSMFDNGDVSIQSRYNGQERGLLFMDGTSGYVFLTAGNARPQEYIELDPLNKVICIVSDQDIHQFNQQDWKITVYNNQIQNIGNVLELTVGIPPSTIPGDFDKIIPDSDMQNGDIKISNVLGTSGKFTLNVKGDTIINVLDGNIQVTAETGDIGVTTNTGNINVTSDNEINVTSNTGNITVNSGSDVNVTSSGDINLTSDGSIYLNGGSGPQDRIATISDIQNHTHTGVQKGGGTTGTSPYNGGSGNAYLGSS